MIDEKTINENIREQILWVITDLWTIPDREDLLSDCIAYVEDIILSLDKPITDIDITRSTCLFLQQHCRDAVSSRDLEEMEKYQNRH
jgi:hypothetical protein